MLIIVLSRMETDSLTNMISDLHETCQVKADK